MAKKQKKKRKLKIGKVILLILIIIVIGYIVWNTTDFSVQNIVIKGNTIYSDQEITEMANLENHPSVFTILPLSIAHTLEKNTYIEKATVTRSFNKIVIQIQENKPIFYNLTLNKTVLYDETQVNANFPVPTLVNYVPDKKYKALIKNLKKIDSQIISRISEIKYDPNDVDENRFMLTMNDGNFVYITLNRFQKMNKYVEIIAQFDNQKGILYLDSGEYFKVLN